MTLRQYIDKPRKDWDDKKWLEHAHLMVHSPWISDDDREYWRDKIKELLSLIHISEPTRPY